MWLQVGEPYNRIIAFCVIELVARKATFTTFR